MPRVPALALTLSLVAATAASAEEATLSGSRSSMIRQNEIAKEQDYSFLRTPEEVERFVEKGILVEVKGNEDYELARVSFPYARPVLVTFVERLGAQYRRDCGEPLVVTSLTRPLAEQPGNASPLSVHPAGMAVDFRISRNAECRQWLESTLLSLEKKGVLDITRERNPPHYHVAVYPEAYAAHVERLQSDSTERAAAAPQRSGGNVELSPAEREKVAPGAESAPSEAPERAWIALALAAALLGLGTVASAWVTSSEPEQATA